MIIFLIDIFHNILFPHCYELNCVPQTSEVEVITLSNFRIGFIWKSIFTEIIQFKWGQQKWALIQCAWCLYKKEIKETHRKDAHRKVQEHLRLLEIRSKAWIDPSLETSEEAWPWLHFDFKPVIFRPVRLFISIILSHPCWW